MSRRDQLVQQNIARARSKPEAPAQQENVGKQPIGSLGPRSFFGGNFDVYSRLESIQFQGALGDGSLRGNVAYIRIWERGGVAAQSQNVVPADSVSGTDNWTELAKVAGDFGLISNITSPFNFGFRDEAFDLSEAEFAFISQLDLPANSLVGRQKALASQTPGSLLPQEAQAPRPGIVVGPSPFSIPRPSPFARAPGGLPLYVPTNPLGTVLSANPNGLVNTLVSAAVGAGLGGFGFRPGLPSYITPFPYQRGPDRSQANAPRSGGSYSLPGPMTWQFLFNPSELELEAGPEFKSAETWAVSDKANSGQPLHWTHNKNAQLKFNSILLNGFIFGRKVEELEQGLMELFMARDGEGQHGPHVLEFVWGKRAFGPCVIKNINVKEKMWDEGEVVNAELSFTLEQIPEWTINDGAYVDVARPGRRPLQEQVANFASGTTAGAAETTAIDESSSTPGAGQADNQKPASTPPANPAADPSSVQKCTNLANLRQNLTTIESAEFGATLDKVNLRFRRYQALYNLANNSKITPLNVGKYTPDYISREIAAYSKERQTPGTFRNKSLTGINTDISSGATFLRGNLLTQLNSDTCIKALGGRTRGSVPGAGSLIAPFGGL
jgi:hypothetical protein